MLLSQLTNYCSRLEERGFTCEPSRAYTGVNANVTYFYRTYRSDDGVVYEILFSMYDEAALNNPDESHQAGFSYQIRYIGLGLTVQSVLNYGDPISIDKIEALALKVLSDFKSL